MNSCACPGCGAPLTVPEALKGKTVRCPKCKNPFTVPAGPSGGPAPAPKPVVAPLVAPVVRPVAKPVAPPIEDDEDAFATRPMKSTRPASRSSDDGEDDDVPRPKKTKAKSSGPNWLLIGGVGGGGLLFVVVAVTLTYFLTSSPGPQAKNADAKKGGGDAKVAAAKKEKEVPVVNLGPMPDRIAAETTQRVKKSTAQIKVTFAGGQVGEGSGFFALEPGLVVTNAHVVGMLHRNQKPDRVEVVINSGEPDADRRDAVILGVDQDEDLALLKIEGAPGPSMLGVDHQTPLTELQSVYIFGFPLGEKHNKSITASTSSISSFKKRDDGTLQYIQVNGGMHPGNSGGPVVDARGNVIGVAVAVIRGTMINFAVPGDRVAALAQGRILNTTYGEPYRDGASIRMPIKLTCLDPMSRIRSMKLDVWTGPAGNARPAGAKAPPMNDESPRKTVDLQYLAGSGAGDVLVPTPAPGKALWIQPVFVQAGGNVVYGPANTVPLNTSTPLVREAVQLAVDSRGVPERTLDIVSKMQIQLHQDKKYDITQTLTADALEDVQVSGRGVNIRVSPGRVTAERNVEGQVATPPQQLVELVKNFGYKFVADENGGLTERTAPSFGVGPLLRKQADELADMLMNAYEATAITMPGKRTRPMDTWTITVPMMVGASAARQTVDLNILCTYEGTRERGGTKVAFIRLEGAVEPRGAILAARGTVKGYALFDVARGMIAKANVAVHTDFEIGSLFGTYITDATIERSPGNDRGIKPAPKTPNTGPLSTTLVMDKKGTLKVDDPVYNGRADKKTPHVAYMVNLAANKNYVIELNSEDFDTYLVLENPEGEIIGEDDDGGGALNSQLIVRVKTAGAHKVVVTHFDKGAGNYHLRVSELGGILPKLFPKIAPKINQSRLLVPDFRRVFPDNHIGAPPNFATIGLSECADRRLSAG